MTRTAPPSKPVPAPLRGYAGRGPRDRFSLCLTELLKAEGGFNDIATDRGGATNFGISLRFLRAEAAVNPEVRALFPAGPIDIEDIRTLTVDQAAQIYLWCFWEPAKCEKLPQPIDGAVFDQAVNAGVRTAGRLLQRAINAASPGRPQLEEDGAIGLITVAAAHRVPKEPLLWAFRLAVENRYRSIVRADPSQKVFLAGWLARAAKLGTV